MKRIVVGKGTQGTLLLAYTALVLAGTLLVEGRPGVVTNLVPFDDLARLKASAGRAGVLSNRFVLGLLGLVFSVGIETVQFFLPTRAADVNDVFWNAVGALLGALLAHLHASVRVDWA